MLTQPHVQTSSLPVSGTSIRLPVANRGLPPGAQELWKSYTRPSILKGSYPFSLPPDRPVYLTSVRDMGRLAGACLARAPPVVTGRKINVASDLLSPALMADAFATAQGTPCVHKKARLLRWTARLFLPDLYQVIQFYRTTRVRRRPTSRLSDGRVPGAAHSVLHLPGGDGLGQRERHLRGPLDDDLEALRGAARCCCHRRGRAKSRNRVRLLVS